MSATNPSPTGRPSRRAVVVAFGIAIGAAVALVALALLLRNDRSTPPATATPVVDLSGIPQRGSVLGSPSARVKLIEYADPQCPAWLSLGEALVATAAGESAAAVAAFAEAVRLFEELDYEFDVAEARFALGRSLRAFGRASVGARCGNHQDQPRPPRASNKRGGQRKFDVTAMTLLHQIRVQGNVLLPLRRPLAKKD